MEIAIVDELMQTLNSCYYPPRLPSCAPVQYPPSSAPGSGAAPAGVCALSDFMADLSPSVEIDIYSSI